LPIDSGRYGSREIKEIFEEEKRLDYQLEFEAAVAVAQAKVDIIPSDACDEIVKETKSGKIRVDRIKELETVSDHDTAALVEALSEQCSDRTKPWIHYGLTSNDVVDTATSMQVRDALNIIEPKIFRLATILVNRAIEFRTQPAVGRTHGQHSSIVSFGLKFAIWAVELAKHIERIEEGKKRFLLCKTLGVVGTGSSMGERALEVQMEVANYLDLYAVDAATQIIPRERYAEIQFLIALTGSTLDKIAVEIRNLQRTEIGEVAEPFRKGQMGSSAVPVKRNPIKSERVSSLARILRSAVDVAMENIPLWHERDLSNSANERFIIPMSMIILDEMLNLMINVISKLAVNIERITSNLDMTNGQIYAEFVLEALIKKGIPRLEAYRNIQRIAFSSHDNKQHFHEAIKKDSSMYHILSPGDLKSIFDAKNHLSASSKIIDNVAKIVDNIHKNFFRSEA
ncbi:MAG: adenylosuccinate lyase, partial [Nitrososphaeraceae archaeon]